MSCENISYPVTKNDQAFAKLWLVLIGVIIIFGLFAEGFSLFGLVACVAMFIIGLYYFNQTVWGLASEVLDCGHFLRVSKSGKTEDIPLNEIKAIDLTYPNHKHLITIKTMKPTIIGASITFRADKGYPLFSKPKILIELKERIKNA